VSRKKKAKKPLPMITTPPDTAPPDVAPEAAPVLPEPSDGSTALEDTAFWYAMAMAVVTCAPPPLFYPAVPAAILLGVRLLDLARRVPGEEAADDRANVRLLTFLLVIVAVLYRYFEYGSIGLVWIMGCMFLQNGARNLRILAKVEKRKAAAQLPSNPK
jgi:hypothetical protein